MVRIFLSHNPEDLGVYFKKAHEALAELGQVVLNPEERDLTTEEVIEAARTFSQITADTRSNWALHLLYYLVVFLPLGALLALPALRTWEQKYRLIFVLSLLLAVPLLLELALVLPSGQGIRPLNAVAGMLAALLTAAILNPIVGRVFGR